VSGRLLETVVSMSELQATKCSPKVSVIIPAFNAMAFLPRTIASVFGQTFDDFEIIVVNDGSTDGIEVWGQTITDPRFRLISQPNQGQSAARNLGIRASAGDYLAFLDADDVWEPSKLAKQVEVLDSNPGVGLVYTWVAEIDTDDRPLSKVWTISAEGRVWEQLVKGNIIACGSVPMVRRRCADEVGPFLKFPFACEDWDYWLRISASFDFKVIKEVLVYYRMNPMSLSHGSPEGMRMRLRNMESSFLQVLESAFATAPPEKMWLKPFCLSAAFMHIGWVGLNTFEMGFEEVACYRRKAVSAMPLLRRSLGYHRLGVSAWFVRVLGFRPYQIYRRLLHVKPSWGRRRSWGAVVTPGYSLEACRIK